MAVADVQATARPQESGHHPGPARDVGEPVERAHAGVHEVEVAAEHLGNRVQLRLHEADVGAARGREIAGHGERRRREVDAGDPPAEARQRERVGADVALHVHDVEAGEVAEPRRVVRDDAAEPLRIGSQAGEVVVVRRRVHRDARFPVAEIRGAVLVEVVDEMRR